MKKVILAAFMLLAVAGTTMAQTGQKDAAGTATQTTTKHHAKKHHGKKHHHKMAAMKNDAGKTQK